jgi:hypothetical protein
MSQFRISFNTIHRQRDQFNEGCDPESGISEWLDVPIIFESDTIPELLEQVQSHFNVSASGILINACDEIGRVDVQTYTKGTKGVKCAYSRYKEAFKRDQCDLWLNDISGTIVKLPEAVDLSEFVKLGYSFN